MRGEEGDYARPRNMETATTNGELSLNTHAGTVYYRWSLSSYSVAVGLITLL